MQLVKFSLLCLLSLSLAGVVVAQTAVDPNSDAGSASLQDFSGGATLSGTYFDVRYQSSRGVGYENGFTQIGAFTPFWVNEDAFIAPNARFLITDKNRIGANLGGVARQYNGNWDRIFGINGYYDTDETNYSNRYQQGTIGIESLGRNWDFRANGYFTFGTTDRFLKEICVGGDPFFVGNQIAFLGQQLREQSMSGADAEVGVPVLPSTPWLRAYAGVYGYQAKQDNYVGFRGRLDANISDDTTVGVMVTTDELFGTNVNATVDFRFSGFKPTRFFPQWATRERMLTSVQRNWRVSTNAYVQNVNVFAINPNDGDEYFVTHVDKTAAPGGDGSVENPLNFLPNSAPGSDLILVSANGTSEGDPLTTLNGLPLVLENNQRLLGEGKAHTAQMFATYGGCVVGSLDPNDPAGTFVLPGFANTGNYPFLSNVGDIVSLANNNEVAAFNMLNAGGFAITNSPAGSNNFLLQCLEISGNIGGGISLTDATGVGIIRGINLNSGSTNHPNPFGTGDNLGGGVFVDTGAAGLNLTMTDVAMNANPGQQMFGVSLLADDGSLTTTMTNVHADGFGPGLGNTVAGIILAETGETLTATLDTVSANNNEGVGVMVTGTGGAINLFSDSLTANDNRLDNLQIGTQAAPLVGTVFHGDISDSFFNGSLEGSGIVYSQEGVSGLPNTLTLTNIQADNNFVDGLGLFGTVNTSMDVTVTDSSLTGNQRDGIHVEELTGATINLVVDPTDISGNGRDGFFFSVDASTLNASFVGLPGDPTNLSDNDRNALHGEVTNGSLVNLSLDDITADRSGADGFFFNVDDSTMNVVARRTSIQESGRLGVVGSGILGNVSNAGTVTFGTTTNPLSGLSGFSQSTISNNLDNGMFVTASGQSNVQAVFSTVRFDDNGNTTAGDGIRLDLDDSPNSSLDLLASTTVNRNGRHGFELNATNGTNFTSTFTGTRINDNGQDGGGSGVQVNVDNSTVVQTFNNVNITNTNSNPVPGGTQEIGYEFNVSNAGSLTADFPLGGSLSNNLLNAVSGLVTDPASIASISLVDVTADNSGSDGASLLVTNEGVLDFSASDGTSFSNGGGAGVVVFAAGINSVANLAFDEVVIDGNADDGVLGVALAEATLNACITQTSIQDNGLTGINLNIIGAGGNPSVGNIHIENSTVDGNQEEGLLANAQIGGQINYRSVDTSYDGNGLAGTFDGVQMNSDGAGSRILSLFSGNLSSASGNSDDGYEFNATNGATLTAELDGTTASGNGGFGLNFNAQDAGTNAALLMTGTNDFSGNTGGTININVGAVNQIVLSLTGSFDNNNGDGIFLDINGATNALVAIQGGGTVSGNQNIGGPNPEDNGDGIDIRMTNVTNGSILISGMTDISNNDADGIHIEMDTVTSGALEINGIAAVNNNGDDAIDISLVNTTLDGAVALATTAFEHLTLVDSVLADDPLTPLFDETCLPLVVTTDLGTLGLVADPFTINQVVADNNTNHGININASSSTIVADGGVITNNQVSNSQNGDGLHLDFNTVSADGLLIDGNSFSNNSDNGMNFNLLNSPIDRLTITNNTGGVSVNTGLNFVITGNTFLGNGTFNIGNTSDPGIDILGFTFDLSTIAPTIPAPFINYDSNGGGPFTPFGGTDVTTGLQTVNSTPVPPYPVSLVAQGSQVIDLTFNDFNSGEQFQWDADLDPDLNVQGTVNGDELAGAFIHVDYTGGLFQEGNLVVTGPLQSSFVATSGNIGGSGVANNGLDGIRFNLNSSSLTNLVMEGNQVEANGTTGTGHGINFQAVTNSDITAATITNNIIDGNAGDGFHLITPNTAGGPIGLTFQDNTITNNTNSGINIQVNNAEVLNINLESVTTGNQISDNIGFGVLLGGLDTSTVNVISGGAGAAPNTYDGNGGAGLTLDLRNSAVGSLNVSNSTFSGSLNGAGAGYAGEGLAIRLSNSATLPNAVIGNPALANTIFTGNANNGISIIATDDAVMDSATIDNIQALTNTGDGLNITRNGTANFTNFLIQESTFQGNTADGIDISAQFFPNTDDYSLINNQVLSNNGRGLSFLAQADAQIDTLLSGNTFDDNGQDGVQITTVLISAGDAANVTSNVGTWVDNDFTNNGRLNGAGGAGLEISGVHTLNIGTLALGNRFTNNAGDGIEVNTSGTLNIINATITGNNTAGSANGLAGIDINSQGGNTINVSNSVISNNLGDGVEFDDNSPGAAPSVVTLTDNLIQFNSRDGVEFMVSGSGVLNIVGTSLTASQITNNGFRGVDIVAQGSGGAVTNGTANISLTSILANTQEGVNVILTSSPNQTNAANRDALSSAALDQTGTVGVSPFLTFNLADSVINNNGQVAGNIGGSGLNMRVGTTRGGQNFNVAGGFASGANGGVVASVTGNSFSGNFGADVLFESFTSTVNPTTTAGAWTDQNENPRGGTADVFTPSNFQSDPLARLDLVFNNNVGQELNGTRQGAFYNNDESVFKSRTAAQDNGNDGGADDNGPFGSGTRLRNAQRLAARDVAAGGTQLPPLLSIGASDSFLFSGLGQSTFRVDTSGGGNVFGSGNGFILDGNPYIDVGDANGVNGFGGGPFGIDSMPWGWSVLP